MRKFGTLNVTPNGALHQIMFGGIKSRLCVSYLSGQPFAFVEGAAMAWERAL
jgi:hypothetical protein